MTSFLDQVLALDKNDKLAAFKDRFVQNDQLIYLDGNSLGKLPKKSVNLINDLVTNQWGQNLIRSWNDHWIDLSQKTAAKIAQLVGAAPDEIFVGDTTSINLYKLLFGALTIQKGKQKILTDSLNFPSDLYVLEGLVKQHFKNHSLEKIPTPDGIITDLKTLESYFDTQTALLTLSLVTYKSAFWYPMDKVNAIVHQHNSLVIWDLSHAIGAVPIDLNGSNADMAVGCTYKYLNGGPGAPAFLYVKKALQSQLSNPIWSWFSHQVPFKFDPNYSAAKGIDKFAISTPSILSLAPIQVGVDILLKAGMAAIREKSILQTELMLTMITHQLYPLGFKIASPFNADIRGSHISIAHPEAYRINRAMIAPQNNTKIIIPDFRPPNQIRLGIAPLYTSFMDLYQSIERIRHIVMTKEYERFDKVFLQVI
ncbi:MAG: kynureninase [Lutibacter sp.]